MNGELEILKNKINPKIKTTLTEILHKHKDTKHHFTYIVGSSVRITF